MTPALRLQAEALVSGFAALGRRVAAAESCTGGLITATMTSVAGASAVVDRGFVTYSNEAKREVLGVGRDLLEQYGAVSEQVARAMAEGALARSNAVAAVAVTGVAGPGGGSVEKPVGLVHLAVAWKDRPTEHRREVYDGDRDAIRDQTVATAFDMLLSGLGTYGQGQP